MAEDNLAETRIPVIIGVGQVNDRPADDADALDSRQLMEAAIHAADKDAGGGFIPRIDWLGITRQISFPSLDKTMVEGLCTALGIAPAHAEQSRGPNGDTPIRYLNDAANAIGEGRAQVAVIVGGEALRTAARRPDGGGIGRNMRMPEVPPVHVKYGLRTPADIYPFYENAGRKAWGQTLAEGQAETGLIWSLFSEVAAANPAAWLRKPVSAVEIVTAGANNRPIAFPYTKLMVANSSVNQGAALLVTSLAVARAAGVPESRIVYVGKGAAAHEAEDVLARARWDTSPSMAVTLEQAIARNGLDPQRLDHLELYSCFPCVPKMARRILGLPAERPATVFGGLTFGGGPIGNYMAHAAASMVEKLRAARGDGLLFANGGFATHNHAILLTTRPQPAGTFPQDYDCQQLADARRGAVPELVDGYEGPAEIETYTVIYDREARPKFGVVLARTPDGRRAIARIPGEDEALIAFLTSGAQEPVGTAGTVVREGEFCRWSRG
jgi:acetyl-CoA C-acetyltransferase